jgi:putative membrane-bound dehydrogenase-like protein
MPWTSRRPSARAVAALTLLLAAPVAAAGPEALLREVKVPDGFAATVFAAPPQVAYPVFVAAAPDGTVYVSCDRNGSLDRAPHRGSVVRLRDTDNDGRADEAKAFVPDVDSPRGLVWDRDRLYLMHPPDLSAFVDDDSDGVADRKETLVKGIAFNFKDRPADHTSNGVTLGIDGWLYLAIGDFGFVKAEGRDGRTLQLRGGGVVRVRPDGTGLEVVSRGTRNILEVSLDGTLNGFARDNTNDGGGWDIRLHHFSGLEHHGYPSLFTNFPAEVVPPLADYGGGSGCGGLYLDEPGFPQGYGDALYTADWGRQWVYRHRMTPKGATFTADQSEAFGLPRVTDLDVDASSRLYVASWRGASFTYVGENVGFLARVVPKGYTPEPLPDFARLDAQALVSLLESPSSRRRLEAQRTLLARGLDDAGVAALRTLAADRRSDIKARIAAVFALKQGLGAKATPALVELAADATIAEWALRALTDRLDGLDGVPAGPIVAAANSPDTRLRRQAAVSLARLGKAEHAPALVPLLDDADPLVTHTAVAALIELRAADAALAALDAAPPGSPRAAAALRVLQALHEPAVVEGLVSRLARAGGPESRRGPFVALARLAHREGDWKGDSWGTRPDTSGPYYQPEPWAETPRVLAALRKALDGATGTEAGALLSELNRHKVRLDDALAALVARARDDPSLVPGLVGQLAWAEAVPAAAAPLLTGVATGEATDDDLRTQAILALSRSGGPEAIHAALLGLGRIAKPEPSSRPFQQARRAVLESPRLGDALPAIETLARSNDPAALWADAALLTLADRGRSPEVKAGATRAVEAGWGEPSRRVRMLRAIARIEHRASADRVRAALDDPDAAVASAAREAASALRLDRRPRLPQGPKVNTLSVAEVLDRIPAAKGNREVGAELFGRLNCANCHTVRADEPPRGPYLGNIAATYPRRELAEAVLVPSKTLAQGFVTTLFELEDGTTVTGFVVREAADAVVIRTAEAKELSLSTASVVGRAPQAVSVMPEGLVADLTLPEFASLIAYLESLRQDQDVKK